MKVIRTVFLIILSAGFLCTSLFAQKETCYKGVCITRSTQDKNCVYIKNDNAYDVNVRIDYKLVSDRNAPWINYPGMIRVAPRETGSTCIGRGEIKALRVAYVEILKPSVGEEILKVLWGDGNENNQ